MHFLAGIFLAIGSFFGLVHPPAQQTAAVVETQHTVATSPVQNQGSATPPATTTIINNITNPVIERIIEKAPGVVLGASTDTVTHQELADAIAAAKNQFTYSFSGSPENTPVTFAAFASSQKIDQLSGVTISNSTIDSNSIPDLSGQYLSIMGGTSAARSTLGLSYASTTDIDNSYSIATWGDSLTAGNEDGSGTTYPNALQSLSGYTVYNGGVGGETSTQIKTRMLAATSKYGWPTIIWAGRNNYSDPTTVKADIAAMVAALGSNQNYLVLSILNGDYNPSNYSGGSSYNQIIGINNDLAATYGSHYLDIRSYLVSLYDSNNSQDVIDHGHDIPPSSLRYDQIHLNAAGYTAVAQKIYENISILQNNPKILTSTNAAYLFKVLGAGSSSNGHFNQLSVGTTTTTNAFEVSGNIRQTNGTFTIQNDSGAIKLQKSDGTGTAQIKVSGNGNYVQITGSGIVPSTDNIGGLGIASQRWNNIIIGTGDSSFAGRLGVGTTTPLDTLAVNGNLSITGSNSQIRLRNGDAATTMSFDFPELSTQAAAVRLFRSTNTSSGGVFQIFKGDGSATIQTQFSSIGNDYTNAVGGNFGIGTSTPQNKLSVSGGSISLNQDGGFIYLHMSDGSGTGAIQVSGNGNYVQTVGSGVVPGTDNVSVLGLTGQRWSALSIGTGNSTFAGSVGVGTTTPWAKFSLARGAGSTIPAFVISTSTASATSTALIVDGNGQLGLATSTPWRTLSVTGTVGLDGLTGSTGAGSLCLSANKEVVYNSGSDSCLSSTRATKHDINNLDIDAIVKILALQSVSFIYNNDTSSTTRYGFIAEDTAAVDKHLATYDANGNISGIDDRSIISVIVKALQSLIQEVGGFADNFMSAHITATVADIDTANIKNANIENTKTKNLCVGSTCVTEEEFKALLQKENVSSTPTTPTSPTPEPEATSTSTPEADSTSSPQATSTSETLPADESTSTPEI